MTLMRRWVGSKRTLLPALRAELPASYGRYWEPMVGSGALFFDLRPRRAVLADANADLMVAYRCVRDDVEGVIQALRGHAWCESHYLRVRALSPSRLSPPARAARALYLVHAGFNGLWRVNSHGRHNVPWGGPGRSRPAPDDLRRCSRRLRGVALSHGDYASPLVATEPGDFVYLDPPYVPLSSTSSFTAYTASGWSADDHRRLAKTFVALAARGVQVLLSNSDTPLVRRLYAGWRQVPVVAPRSLGASTGSAGSVGELLISSGFPRLRPSYS